MDGTLWQTAGWVLLGWCTLSLVVAAGLGRLFRRTQAREQAVLAELLAHDMRPRHRHPRRPAA